MAKRKLSTNTTTLIRHPHDTSLLLIRVVFGGAMIYGHGVPKLMKLFGDGDITFADPIGLGPVPSLLLAIFAEVFCAFLVVIGWWTRWALVPLVITMLVASFVVHLNDGFRDMEMALLYLMAYTAILISGPGKYSIDKS